MIDYANQSCLAGAVRAKQSVDFSARHLERYIVESGVIGKSLSNVFCFDYRIHIIILFTLI